MALICQTKMPTLGLYEKILSLFALLTEGRSIYTAHSERFQWAGEGLFGEQCAHSLASPHSMSNGFASLDLDFLMI